MWCRKFALFFLLSPLMIGQTIDASKVATVQVYRQGRLLNAVSKAYDGDIQMIDSSSIRVHQHAANVKKGARRLPPLGTSLQPHAWGARGAD